MCRNKYHVMHNNVFLKKFKNLFKHINDYYSMITQTIAGWWFQREVNVMSMMTTGVAGLIHQ